jgi:hypothetical protein
MNVIESADFRNMTASAQLKDDPGRLLGIFVASASATPTIKVWANGAASGAILVNTFTPVAGTFYPMPARFSSGLYVSIGGTVDCTVFFV